MDWLIMFAFAAYGMDDSALLQVDDRNDEH